jgi:L-lactate dehydrogenase (cytochrome)
MRLGNCHNFHDFRALAKRRLPGPIFDYIDGAADDASPKRGKLRTLRSGA